MWGYREMRMVVEEEKKRITVVYDKGKDNDATLRSKLVSAYRKTNTELSELNKDLQHLKKHKSVEIYY